MAARRALQLLLLPVALAASAAPQYALDASWPAPHPSYNMSQITAVAVLNNVSASGGGTEVHVAQRGASCAPIVVFDVRGAVLRTWGEVNLTSVHGLSAHIDTLFATDIAQGTVKEFTPLGALLRVAGTPGVHGPGLAPVQFDNPADVAVTGGPSNLIVVADGDGGSNNRVLALAPGDMSTVVYGIGGGNGTGPGEFSSPHSVAYDAGADTLLVADRGNKRVQLFAAANGLWLGEWLSGACFTVPWGIRVDPVHQLMFVADGDNGLLTIASYAGAAEAAADALARGAAPPPLPCTLSQNFTVGIPGKPHELAYDADSRALYLAGVGAVPTLQRYNVVA